MIVKRATGLFVALVTGVVVLLATATADAGPPITIASWRGAPVTLTVTVRLPLVCGHLRGPLSISMTTGITLPASIRSAAVLINGRSAARVTVSGRNVTVSPAAQSGVTCQSIALGQVTVVFTPQTGISSSRSAGTHAVVVHRGSSVARGLLTIAH